MGKTVLSGTSSLDGMQWHKLADADWLDAGADHDIYAAALPASSAFHGVGFVQLFSDDSYIPEARWPNAQLSTMLDRDSTWATMKAGSGWGVVHDPELANNVSRRSNSSSRNVNWNDARVTLNLGSGVFTWVQAVQNYSHANTSFRYPATSLHDFKRPDDCPEDGSGPCKEFVGNRYFLQGALGALDSPGEWWLNTTSWTVYIWMPDGSKPTDGRLSAKVRDYCILHEGPPSASALASTVSRHPSAQQQERQQEQPAHRALLPSPSAPPAISGSTSLHNLSFHGCTFHLLDCTDCVVSDVEALYVTVFFVDSSTMMGGRGVAPHRSTLELVASYLC